jgi:hypothetical protein
MYCNLIIFIVLNLNFYNIVKVLKDVAEKVRRLFCVGSLPLMAWSIREEPVCTLVCHGTGTYRTYIGIQPLDIVNQLGQALHITNSG